MCSNGGWRSMKLCGVLTVQVAFSSWTKTSYVPGSIYNSSGVDEFCVAGGMVV